MEYNADFQYDLKFGKEGETEIAKLLNNSEVEVKRDRQTQKTGNVYIEYESRGKPSGIKTTKANKLEAELETLSEQKTHLETAMSQPEAIADSARMQQHLDEYAILEKKISDVEAAWFDTQS